MGRRKRKVIQEGGARYKTVISGGPKKYLNRRRIRLRNAKRIEGDYSPIDAAWFLEIIQEVPIARNRLKLTQLELAGTLGTSQAEICRLEKGKTNPTVEFLDRLFEVLEIKLIIDK
ncbi:MAG TPA: helix-turn-helix transcriptional regulator [Candidatus Saccharimonadales bacterium]|nr:helix-turn-helix transcriptional regulator [Candidatus Saccharimonadales bacterium]